LRTENSRSRSSGWRDPLTNGALIIAPTKSRMCCPSSPTLDIYQEKKLKLIYMQKKNSNLALLSELIIRDALEVHANGNSLILMLRAFKQSRYYNYN